MGESQSFSWSSTAGPPFEPRDSQTDRYREFLESELQDRIDKLALAESSAGVGIWDIDIQSQTVRGTAQFFHLMGLPPVEGGVPITAIRALRVEEDRDRVVQGYAQTISSGRDVYETEYRIRRPDGAERWIYGRGKVIRDAAGTPVRYSGVDIDITDRKAAETAQRASEARLKVALDAAGLGVWEAVAGGSLRGSPELNRILGFEPGRDISGDELRARYLPGEYERLRGIGQAVVAAREKYLQVEFRLRWPDDSVHWILLRAEIQFGSDGKPTGALGVAMDITDRKSAEERQLLMMRELDHRVKNTLATVQAIASQTFRSVDDVPAAISSFNARLAALAGAHGVLTSVSWQSADLADIVAAALRPFRDEERERFEIVGSRVLLTPQLALAVAMTLHELCTNAAKYGALAAETGKVKIRWQVEASSRRLRLEWQEVGGPLVKTPTRRGFGSRLITGGFGPGAEVALDFDPTGVVCKISVLVD